MFDRSSLTRDRLRRRRGELSRVTPRMTQRGRMRGASRRRSVLKRHSDYAERRPTSNGSLR
jgi:hypothetical protein